MENNSIIYINWNRFDDILFSLAQKVLNDGKPDIILSVVRGGMIPSVMISHILNIRNVQNIIAKETIDDSIEALKGTLQLEDISHFAASLKGKKILVVDDIVGSGNTILTIKKLILDCAPKEVKLLTCCVNDINWEKNNISLSSDNIEYIGMHTRGWVVFPWEKVL